MWSGVLPLSSAEGLTRKAFHDPADFPGLLELQGFWADMAQEAETALERLEFLRFRFPNLYDVDRPGVVGRRAMFYLRVLGADVQRNCALAPRTAAAVQAVPGVATAAFYVLEPGARILPHCGVPQDPMLRAHLGLICPPNCYLRVGREQRAWTEGSWIVFDDRPEHEAWNGSDRTRCVLSLDFLPHPSPEAWTQVEELRAAMLSAKTSEAPWYLAAGIDAGPEMTAEMTRKAHSLPARKWDNIRSLVETNGLFFT